MNSRLRALGGTTYLGGKLDAFFNFVCVLGVFLGGIWDSGGGGVNSPQKIAGINTAGRFVGAGRAWWILKFIRPWNEASVNIGNSE